MSRLLSLKFWNEYSAPEWMCTKILVAFFWLLIIMGSTVDHETLLYPSGIFSIVNGSFLASRYTGTVFFILAFILTVLYMAEKWMVVTTFAMFLLSLVLFTLEESSGVLGRNGLYTMTFLAQSIAYYRNTPRLSEERVQFPVQIVAAGYMLAGISKLQASGLHWVTDSPRISIQLVKSYSSAYFNSGDIKQLNEGLKHARFILSHKYIVEMLCAFSLLLEVFAWVAVKNKLTAFVYGLLLLAMHLGILYFMDILIKAIYYPMLIYMVNPLYFIYLFLSDMWTKFNQAPTGKASITQTG